MTTSVPTNSELNPTLSNSTSTTTYKLQEKCVKSHKLENTKQRKSSKTAQNLYRKFKEGKPLFPGHPFKAKKGIPKDFPLP